jgi:tRNA pseudouridine55 synthase
VNGVLIVNKPSGITSFDVIRQLRRITGIKKIGHTGTLDPLASGVMILLFGSATKRAAEFSKLDKSYEAEVTLGSTSTTGDAEGEISGFGTRKPELEEVESVLKSFEGRITQTPPVYSAVKIDGQEAYKRARRGETVEMPARQVTIHTLKLISYEHPLLKLSADVSSGTYIRTLAEDIGKRLGTGTYLSKLVRTRVGEFSLEQAIKLDSDKAAIEAALEGA